MSFDAKQKKCYCVGKALVADRLTCLWSVVSSFARTPNTVQPIPRRDSWRTAACIKSLLLFLTRPTTTEQNNQQPPSITKILFSPFISTQSVKLTKGNIMDGFLKGNYVVRYKSFLKRGLLK